MLEVKPVVWRRAGDFPIENSFDVLIFELEVQFRYINERAVEEICNIAAIPGESIFQLHSTLARLMGENPTILHMEMAVRLFLESYPKHQQKANRRLLRRQPSVMARSENYALKHVADVIHEEENQQTWSKMQSVRVFKSGTQGSVQRAPVQSSPVRTHR